MIATTGRARHAALARRTGSSKPVIGVLATVLALWLGLSAPSVSPVAAVAPIAQVSPTAARDQPADLPFVSDHGHEGRGRR